jgi:hypothetical protein
MGGRVSRAVAAALLCTTLVACTDDAADPGSSSSTESGSSDTPSGSIPSPSVDLVLPEGVDVTPGGTELTVGETATVTYEVRQRAVAVLDLTVTRLEETTFKESFVGWDIDAETRTKQPYFVRVTVTNRGETDMSGRPVPLYLVDGNNTLVEATTFQSTFKPCSPGVLPKKFVNGKSTKTCLVFLAPDKGELTAVSFRPTQEFDPITWTGELQTPKPPKSGNAQDR